jgi:hypothetical protein
MPLIQTTGDLITFCLRTAGINGVGQTPMAEDSNTGLQLLSNILAEWQRKRWKVYSLVDTGIMSTGSQTYTVGPTGDFAIARPERIDAAVARMNPGSPQQLDFTLGIFASYEDYYRVVVKTLSTFPGGVFYESAWPMGILHYWPIPAAGAFELRILTKTSLPVYTTLTDAIALPPEYMSALTYCLAVELAMNYGLDPRPSVAAKMRVALNTITVANTQVGLSPMPSAVLPRGGSGMSAGSDPWFQSGGMA